MQEKTICSCRKKGCPRHGDCAACEAWHKTEKRPPYCRRKTIMRKLFGEKPPDNKEN